MKLGTIFSVALLGASAAIAQEEANGTLFDIATTENKTLGVDKFLDLLTSDPGFQPVIDLLANPGNNTVFIPNDKAITSFLNAYKAYAKTHRIKMNGEYPAANATYNNITAVDLINYHITPERVNLTNLTDNAFITNSLLNETGVAFFNGSGLPLLIESNVTFANFHNETWLSNSSNHVGFEVGNGVQNGSVVYKDLNATNGLLNVINAVLIPPMKPSIVLADVKNTTTLSKLLKQHPTILDTLNNSTNFTLFAPNNRALSKIDFSDLDNATIQNIILTHVVPGLYYSTNISNASITAENGSYTANVTTLNNVTLPFYFNQTDGAISLNNTVNVTDPNVFFNNGVMHVIDGILMPPANETNSTTE